MNDGRNCSNQLTICIVNYNGERYLEELLRSVFTQKEKINEVILIDNASQDKSLNIVIEKFPTVKVIQLEKNYGPALARNIGFKEASNDMILFVDNDVILTPDCTVYLIKALKDNLRAIVATPRVIYAHDKKTIQYEGSYCHYLGFMILHKGNLSVKASKLEERGMGSLVSACFLVDRKKWTSDDPFDRTFFMYFEDHDFGIRTRAFGHEILSVPSACCYHYEGTEGLSLRKSGNYSKLRVFLLMRNRWQLILKNYEPKTLLVLTPMFLIYEIFQFLGVLKKGWIVEWFKAISWIAIHPIEILKKRRFVQNTRTIPDREILQDGPIPFTKYLTKSYIEEIATNLLDRLTIYYWKKTCKFI